LRRQKKDSFLKGTILWVDGKRAGNPLFVPVLRKKGLDIEVASTGKAALNLLKKISPQAVVVDASSMRTSGLRICRSVRDNAADIPIILIANGEKPPENDSDINVVLQHPFTIRKLVNRIVPILPAKHAKVMKVGAIELDLDRFIVRCEDREAQLTPRLAKLLKMLMDEPGVVIEREKLFQEVWNTEYIGDTRTLDVHISWLRKAFEKDPRKPQFLKTIRGVGYRFDKKK
jgi:DNA-binding response OmpR family regulator